MPPSSETRRHAFNHETPPRMPHPSPLARELSIDALRLTPLDTADNDQDCSAASTPSSLSRSSSRRRRRSSGFSNSNPDSPYTSPAASPLFGSYKHSLLSGRMASPASPPSPFTLTLSVHSLPPFRNFFVPPKVQIPFEAQFYELSGPWVGTIDLDNAPELKTKMFLSEGGYRVPPKGQVHLIIMNQLGTVMKILVVPYDFKDMPPGSQAPLRRVWYGEACHEPNSDLQHHPDKDKDNHRDDDKDKDKDAPIKEVVRYAVHLKFVYPQTRPTPPSRPRAHSAGHSAAHRNPFSQFAMTSISSANVEHETVDSDEGDMSSHSAGEGSSLLRVKSLASSRKKNARSASMDSQKIFLSGEIRLAFASRIPDEEEVVRAESEEGSVNNRYFSYNGSQPLEALE